MVLVHSKATIATPLLIKTLPLVHCFLASKECTESGTKLDFFNIKIHQKTQSDGSYKSKNFTISNKISVRVSRFH
jgi:hypothetical protein